MESIFFSLSLSLDDELRTRFMIRVKKKKEGKKKEKSQENLRGSFRIEKRDLSLLNAKT